MTSSASSLRLVKPAAIAMITPSRSSARCGVRNLGSTREKNRGSGPSRLIAKKTPVWPSSRVVQTVVETDRGAEADDARVPGVPGRLEGVGERGVDGQPVDACMPVTTMTRPHRERCR